MIPGQRVAKCCAMLLDIWIHFGASLEYGAIQHRFKNSIKRATYWGAAFHLHTTFKKLSVWAMSALCVYCVHSNRRGTLVQTSDFQPCLLFPLKTVLELRKDIRWTPCRTMICLLIQAILGCGLLHSPTWEMFARWFIIRVLQWRRRRTGHERWKRGDRLKKSQQSYLYVALLHMVYFREDGEVCEYDVLTAAASLSTELDVGDGLM